MTRAERIALARSKQRQAAALLLEAADLLDLPEGKARTVPIAEHRLLACGLDRRCARVRALSQSRAHVACADVRHFAPEVLGHRIILSYDGQAEGVQVAALVAQVCAEVPDAV